MGTTGRARSQVRGITWHFLHAGAIFAAARHAAKLRHVGRASQPELHSHVAAWAELHKTFFHPKKLGRRTLLMFFGAPSLHFNVAKGARFLTSLVELVELLRECHRPQAHHAGHGFSG